MFVQQTYLMETEADVSSRVNRNTLFDSLERENILWRGTGRRLIARLSRIRISFEAHVLRPTLRFANDSGSRFQPNPMYCRLAHQVSFDLWLGSALVFRVFFESIVILILHGACVEPSCRETRIDVILGSSRKSCSESIWCKFHLLTREV